MGEAKNKKQKIEKYLMQIKEFISTLPIYQQKKEIILYKSGKEILELHKKNMLSIKDPSEIIPSMKYEAKVSEWQFVNHEQTLISNLSNSIKQGIDIDIENVFENYRKWIKEYLDKNCKEKPNEFRITDIEFYKKFLEEKKKAKAGKEEKKPGIFKTIFGRK